MSGTKGASAKAGSGKSASSASSGSSGSSGASGASGSYTVKEGDTLGSIARENNVNYQDLARWNNIEDPNRILPSQKLRLNEP
jgi:lipoprotein NlpD